MDPFFGSLLGAGTSILGGLLGNNSQEDMFDQQMDLQRDMATHGIRWKVNDAQKAGIHPIYALGAPPFNFSPIGLGGNSLGEGIANAGSALAQGLQGMASPQDKALQKLALERAGLENDLLRAQIQRTVQPAPGSVSSAKPIPGGPGAGIDIFGRKTPYPGGDPERNQKQQAAFGNFVSDPGGLWDYWTALTGGAPIQGVSMPKDPNNPFGAVYDLLNMLAKRANDPRSAPSFDDYGRFP